MRIDSRQPPTPEPPVRDEAEDLVVGQRRKRTQTAQFPEDCGSLAQTSHREFLDHEGMLPDVVGCQS